MGPNVTRPIELICRRDSKHVSLLEIMLIVA